MILYNILFQKILCNFGSNFSHNIGIDTLGGVRVPAAFCGVIGFRPSYGVVSHTGIIPVSSSLDTVGMYEEISSAVICNIKF